MNKLSAISDQRSGLVHEERRLGTSVPSEAEQKSEVRGQRSEVGGRRLRADHPESQAPGPKTQDLIADQLLTLDLHKSYRKGPGEVPVLRGVSLGVRQGEFLAIVGQSGCGKSTLLHLLGTLDAPDRGEIHYAGRRIDNLPAAARDNLRNRHFGMIFQFYHLLPELNTLENVLSPLMIAEGVWSFLRHRRRHRAARKNCSNWSA